MFAFPYKRVGKTLVLLRSKHHRHKIVYKNNERFMFDSLFFYDQSPLDGLHLYSQMGIRLRSGDQIEN
jgi:hypothetical protein